MSRTSRARAAFAAWALSISTHAHADDLVHVQLLGLNDFHGQLDTGKQIGGRSVGGAAVLASYLRDATQRFEGDTLIVHAGDWVGASPPASALLQDEPAVMVLNLLANEACTAKDRMNPRCNIVGTPGNHEFDEGIDELLRLMRGGNAKRGPFLETPWRGARYPMVSATVIDKRTNKTVFPPHVVKRVSGVDIGVIGAVLKSTPSMVVASGVERLRFVDEADAINRSVRALKARGIETIVVTIHQGGPQKPYTGPTQPEVGGPTDGLPDIIAKLDDAVDVVISGHAHSFTNALMKNAGGHPILVTQAWVGGGAFAQIDLTIDKQSHDVVGKTAMIIPTYPDAGPGLMPAADVAALVKRADERVAPLAARVVGTSSEALPQKPNDAGESALGDLIADAQRKITGVDVALMNQGGIRTGLNAGEITWGELFAIQPFSNAIVTMELTGAQLQRVLEQQWEDRELEHTLQVSGLRYHWDAKLPVGRRVTAVEVAGKPLQPAAKYRVAANSFLAGGGSGFTVLRDGKNQRTGAIDLAVLVRYIEQLHGPIDAHLDGRVQQP